MKDDIKFLFMDVDGTLTDGKIYMGPSGEVFKAFDIKDGCGIKDILPLAGIAPIIITARESKILENRCRELGVSELYQNKRDKISQIDDCLRSFSQRDQVEYDYKNVAYIGDDLLDLQCIEPIMKHGGISACPADAAEVVKKKVNFICRNNGGNGAVREFIEWLIDA